MNDAALPALPSAPAFHAPPSEVAFRAPPSAASRLAAPSAARRVGATAGFLGVARLAAMIGALAAVGIVHVWSHTRVTAAGYRLGELQRTQESLRAQHDRLEVEVATLRAPGRLEEFARTRLKMAPPAAGAVVASGVREATGQAGKDRQGPRRAPAGPLVVSANTR